MATRPAHHFGRERAAVHRGTAAELADANERGVTYNGQHYTLYEAGQEQSRLENAVRTCKRHILMNRETGDAKT